MGERDTSREDAELTDDEAAEDKTATDRQSGEAAEDVITSLQREIADLKARVEKDGDSIGQQLPDVVTEQSTVLLTREVQHAAWVGTADRLLRLENEAMATLARIDTETPLRNNNDILQFLPSNQRELRLEVDVYGSRGRIKRTGSLSTILAEMDASEIEGVQMTTKSGRWTPSDESPQFELRLGRIPRYVTTYSGVNLKVSGPDRQWVGGAFDALSAELKKSVPWWSTLRSFPARIAIAVAIAVLISIPILSWLDPSGDGDLILFYMLGTGVFSVLVSEAIQRWALLDFEVIEGGGKARVLRISAALAACVGVVANVVKIVAGA